MKSTSFDPREKVFSFLLSRYDCYRVNTGICPLDEMNVSEISNVDINASRVNGANGKLYCAGMAKLYLTNTFTTPANIHLNLSCGHYSFSDGQHRTCVVSRLLNKGCEVTLKADVTEQHCLCRMCSSEDNFYIKTKFIESMSPLKQWILRDEYNKLFIDRKKFIEKNFLLKL